MVVSRMQQPALVVVFFRSVFEFELGAHFFLRTGCSFILRNEYKFNLGHPVVTLIILAP